MPNSLKIEFLFTGLIVSVSTPLDCPSGVTAILILMIFSPPITAWPFVLVMLEISTFVALPPFWENSISKSLI